MIKNYTYTDKNGDIYRVIFNLSAKKSNYPASDATKDPAGNYVVINTSLGTNNKGNKIVGGATFNKIILVWEYRHNKYIIVHEIGHTLGAALFKPGGDYHSESGLMVESINHPKFHADFIQENIDDIVHEGWSC